MDSNVEELRRELVSLHRDYATLIVKLKVVRDSNLAGVLDRHLDRVCKRMEQVSTMIGRVDGCNM